MLTCSTHAMERACERVFGLSAPFSNDEMKRGCKALKFYAKWHPLKNKWVIEEFDLELIVNEDNKIITVRPPTKSQYNYDKMKSHLDKKNGKVKK